MIPIQEKLGVRINSGKKFPTSFMSITNPITANIRRILGELGALSTPPATLVAVSKLKTVSDINAAYEAGQRRFGENYASELVEKCGHLPSDIKWHFIGHLQSNKVNKLISSCPNLDMVETVDSEKLANKLESAMKTSRPSDRLRVLIEVKTSSEETKSGSCASEVPSLADHIIKSCPHLQFSGLMTIADPEDPQMSFQELLNTKKFLESKGIKIETMSMGMSGDYELAIRHGSNQVRIGSSIFGSR